MWWGQGSGAWDLGLWADGRGAVWDDGAPVGRAPRRASFEASQFTGEQRLGHDVDRRGSEHPRSAEDARVEAPALAEGRAVVPALATERLLREREIVTLAIGETLGARAGGVAVAHVAMTDVGRGTGDHPREGGQAPREGDRQDEEHHERAKLRQPQDAQRARRRDGRAAGTRAGWPRSSQRTSYETSHRFTLGATALGVKEAVRGSRKYLELHLIFRRRRGPRASAWRSLRGARAEPLRPNAHDRRSLRRRAAWK